MPTIAWPAGLAPVEDAKAYLLLNHGPTILISAAHGGQRNVMAAAWNTALDFSPAKVAVVIDKSTATRALVEASGCFAINVPCRAIADLSYTVGSISRRDVGDKFERCAIPHFGARAIDVPLVAGCVAWLECRVRPAPEIAHEYDLFFGEVLAAWADERIFRAGRWHFDDGPQELRTLHHTAGGQFFSPGEGLRASLLGASTAADSTPINKD
jgi:flavin reductase (DIM6/NTAB) family NADH-FMN oxidoreductase RutF